MRPLRRPGHLSVRPEVVAAYLGFVLGWDVGHLPVYRDAEREQSFSVPVIGERVSDIWRRVRALEERHNAQVEFGLPARDGHVGTATVLWAWVSGRDQLRRAAKLRPLPAIVLRMGAQGSESLLLWPLREVIPWVSVEAANDRLCYQLRAPRTRTTPDKLRVPVPGTFLRVGRSRPAPVLVSRLEPDDFTRDEVVGRLRDAPDRNSWRERVA